MMSKKIIKICKIDQLPANIHTEAQSRPQLNIGRIVVYKIRNKLVDLPVYRGRLVHMKIRIKDHKREVFLFFDFG